MALHLLIACHVALGLSATIAGATAMIAVKGPGPHPRRGRLYLVTLAGTAATGVAITLFDWASLWHLALLGTVAVALGGIGYAARRVRWNGWLSWHIGGLSGSYIAMLTAFYVDNGPRLPLWQLLPPTTFWLLPSAVGLPLILLSCHRRHRLLTPGNRTRPLSWPQKRSPLGLRTVRRWCSRR
ncbi:hypothetical protein C8D88_102783 [Lentzea atacamensis]|uniref:DUF2306 domain-containing protein n=2 Tax=Lentzea atacamensis TaxID=531938 RepID=A0A316I8Z1_9PSEU|nr:hypothetical protein C8D88_102783 [Lentzea atacamensis]